MLLFSSVSVCPTHEAELHPNNYWMDYQEILSRLKPFFPYMNSVQHQQNQVWMLCGIANTQGLSMSDTFSLTGNKFVRLVCGGARVSSRLMLFSKPTTD